MSRDLSAYGGAKRVYKDLVEQFGFWRGTWEYYKFLAGKGQYRDMEET